MEKIKDLYKKYKKIINYLIFGGLATVVNFITYIISVRIFGIDKVLSSGIAWFFSVLFAYITNKIFVFESKTKGIKAMLKELTSFFLARIVSGALCDIGTFALMTNVLKINDIISKIVTQIMVVIINYIFSKLIVFKKRNDPKEEQI